MKIIEDEKLVSICEDDANSTLEGFIDIYPHDELAPSPFKTVEECKLFAEIIVKLLEKIC